MIFNMSETNSGGGSDWEDISEQLTFNNMTATNIFAVSNGEQINVVVDGAPTKNMVSPVINLPVAITGHAIAKQSTSQSSASGTISGQTVTFSASKGLISYYYFITGTITN